jgi:hypothetical protein
MISQYLRVVQLRMEACFCQCLVELFLGLVLVSAGMEGDDLGCQYPPVQFVSHAADLSEATTA